MHSLKDMETNKFGVLQVKANTHNQKKPEGSKKEKERRKSRK